MRESKKVKIGGGTVTVTAVETMGNMIDMRDFALREFSREFGGATAIPQMGGWVNPAGELVTESGFTISAFFDADNPMSVLRAEIIAESVARYFFENCENRQDAVIFTVNNSANLITGGN